MIAYKAFCPGLVCRGYQFRQGKNHTDKANCKKNGFHCAEDPLDCLSYYSWDGENEFWMVDAAGDMDEDDIDSKISCTDMTLIARLNEQQFLTAAAAYMLQHPERKKNIKIKRGPFVVERGTAPKVKGENGDWLLALKEQEGEINAFAIAQVGEHGIRPGTEYTVEMLEASYDEG